MLTALDQLLVQLRGVGHVEVAHHHQGAGRPVAAAEVGMAGTGVELPGSSVAQVADQNLPREVELLLQHFGVVQVHHAFARHLVDTAQLVAEETCQGIAGGVPFPENVGLSLLHLELGTADAHSIVTAVVLLLHEEEQLPETPQGVSVTVLEVGE
ncbi:MAG: hypothetical protein GWO24_02515, partial [Akkermansiaceae bacterium]|nr:hypothetical protein [Akkermansiaceae bacterium]